MIVLAFKGLALAGSLAWGWVAAAVVADAALVAASAYSAYSQGQMQKENAKAAAEQQLIQAEMQQLQAEQYAKQAEAYNTAAADAERLSKIELEKAGIAQIQAEQEAEKRSRLLAADIGSVYASAAGNGLLVNGDGSDSFANVLKSTVEEAQMDFSTIKDNGRMSIWEHQSNSQSLLATAAQHRLSAQSAMIGSQYSLLGAQASMLGAANQMKNAKYYNRSSYLGAATAGVASGASAVASGLGGASYARGA